MPIPSRMAWMVPSSPKGPCSAMNATSASEDSRSRALGSGRGGGANGSGGGGRGAASPPGTPPPPQPAHVIGGPARIVHDEVGVPLADHRSPDAAALQARGIDELARRDLGGRGAEGAPPARQAGGL